jgi:transcriptional regulator with XRE-family HTH domain
LIPTTADKLRYFRYKKALLQKDVAEHVGIDRVTYIKYESDLNKLYDFDVLQEIAEFLGVAVDDLLDDYNRFVCAQGSNLKAMRKSRKITQITLASMLNVNVATVKKWEREQVSMTKKSYEKLLQIRG